jgi:hypothetical protein
VPNDGRVATVDGSARKRPPLPLMQRVRLPGRKSRSCRFRELNPCSRQ